MKSELKLCFEIFCDMWWDIRFHALTIICSWKFCKWDRRKLLVIKKGSFTKFTCYCVGGSHITEGMYHCAAGCCWRTVQLHKHMTRVGRKLSVTKEGIFTNFRCYCVGAHTSCEVHMCGGSTHHVGFTCDHIIYILQCGFWCNASCI